MNRFKFPGGRSPVWVLAIIIAIVLAVVVIPRIFLIGTEPPGSRSQQEGAQYLQIPQEQNTDEEIIVSDHQTTLYLPDGAVNLTGDFLIVPRQPDLFAYASETEWSRPIVVDIQYRNEEGVIHPGITFSEPVRICFTLTPEQWEEFTQRPDDFQVQYFDDQQSPSRWISLPMTMDPDRSELCSETDHLSLYALAIRSTDVIPITGATRVPTFVPTPTPFPTLNTQDATNPNDSDDENKPPSVGPTQQPKPTRQPTQPPPPTEPDPTEPPPTDPPTDPPPTDPASTEPPKPEPTEPEATEPPIIELPPITP